MQWRMLGRRGGQASWTIVGDAAQSAWPDLDEARRARDEALRGKQVRRFHLSTNYRNSAEIFEFAAEVVAPGRCRTPTCPIAVRRTGSRAGAPLGASRPSSPRRVPTAVAELLDAVDGTVGVITPAGAAAEVAGWLGDRRRRRVQVVDGMRAKGMEYDGVVVVAPEEIAAESAAGIRVLYVALTRATHRLITLSASSAWRPPD